jgi:DNA-binding transcriptional MerR regulator
MAIFNIGTKNAPQEAAPPDAPDALTGQILQMRQQGFNNNQIVQTLQRAGYKPHQIFDAMNYAELQAGGGPIDQQVDSPEGNPPDMPPADMPMDQQGYAEQQPQEYVPEATYGYSNDRVEELVEAVVEEKWAELVKSVNKVIAWKSTVENRLVVLEQRFEDLRHQFEQLNKGLLEKINEYDQNITNVGTEIKAMERVFQKVLPTFTENINELSRISKNIKDSQGKKE